MESKTVLPSDIEAREFDLGVTSVRLIRVGNVVQLVFSRKLAAELYFAEASTRFKKEEDEFRR